MYQLIQLSDLESDYINPHDATSECCCCCPCVVSFSWLLCTSCSLRLQPDDA